jgi:hypothetical protein
MGFIDFVVNRSFRDEKRFVSPGDAVAVSGRPMNRAQRIALAIIAVLVVAVALVIAALVRAR